MIIVESRVLESLLFAVVKKLIAMLRSLVLLILGRIVINYALYYQILDVKLMKCSRDNALTERF